MNQERAALFAAVIADPTDIAVRLVLADWLEENGEGERAEFIRVQIALANWPCDCDSEEERVYYDECRCKERGELRCRERELLNIHGYSWAGEAAPWIGPPRDWPQRFHRGFVECVSLTCTLWLAHGPAIVRAQPVTSVRLPGIVRGPVLVMDGDWCIWRGSGEGDISDELWRLLEAEMCRDGSHIQAGTHCHYDCADDGEDDLSQACLTWAHKRTDPIPGGSSSA